MALPPTAKRVVIVLFTPLLLVSHALWVVNLVYYQEQWTCRTCNGEDEASLLNQFLFFSIWSLWLTTAVFVAWAFSARSILTQRLFWVALPHVCTVMGTYIYYVASYPTDVFLDYEACHVLGRSSLSKELEADPEAVATRVYLVFSILVDAMVHYLSAPLLLLLLFSGEIDYAPKIPYSTLFMVVLGGVVILKETFGSTIYCGNIWFNVGMSIFINLVFHVLFALWHRRMPSFLCSQCCPTKTKRETKIVNEVSTEELRDHSESLEENGAKVLRAENDEKV